MGELFGYDETDTRVNIIDPKLYQSGLSNNLITRDTILQMVEN